MLLRIRHALIILVGGIWLTLSFLFLPRTLSGFEALTWFAALFAAMVVVDRLYVAFVRRRHGVDPMTLHWSELRNRDGDFFCAACRSIFLLPPEDLDERSLVHCGDCGHAVAPYGEMKPLVHEQGRRKLAGMARRLRH